MAEMDDPWLVDAVWRVADLTRGYLDQDRAQVASCLGGLEPGRLERVFAWSSLEHDRLFGILGEPSMTVRDIYEVAALAPPEIEFATTTAVRRVAMKESTLLGALKSLALLERIHAVTINTVVMLLETHGRTKALKLLDEEALDCERKGYPRPYPIT
ncbi:hypothetical protein [Streptomyces acidiscabies]|uniref:hypothetical protein n=1 Tax=Streptomyces acidiscabies TaxID=42234 RepID=UPI00096AB477|nr:hypothetical protein [Streptomyces acidiscabies]